MAEEDCQDAVKNSLVQSIVCDKLETVRAMSRDEILRFSKSTVFYALPKQSPLHVAALVGNSAAVSLLLSAGVEVNVECPGGRTPLYWAVTQGHTDIASKLLDAGGDLTLLPFDSPRRTALHYAASCGHYDVARFLIENVKVDVSIRNYSANDETEASGGTALDEVVVARRNTLPVKVDLVMLLLRALAQCGGPVPRVPCAAFCKDIGFELHECVTDDDREFAMGLGLTRVRHWREAAALQRRLQVSEYPPTSIDYDPDLMWAPPRLSAVDAEAAARGGGDRWFKRQRRRKDD
jgi:hypothetical protein